MTAVFSPELGALIGLLAEIARLRPPSRRVSAEAVDPLRLGQLITEHQLGPFLAARRAPLPPELASAVSGELTRATHASALREDELHHVARALDDQIVLLKGSALQRTLYAHAAERAMSDLDLLILPRERFLSAFGRLEQLGYRRKGPARLHHHAPPLHDPIAETTVELHENLRTPPLGRLAMVELWQRRVRVGRLALLDPYGRLCHHAVHALHDPIDSPLLRNLFEVAWMAAHFEPKELRTLARLARRWGLFTPVARALRLAAELFGSPRFGPAFSGARELWSRSRLEWTGSFETQPRWWQLRRHLALNHIAALNRGASEFSPLAFITVALAARPQPLPAAEIPPDPPLERAPWPYTEVGDGFLVHDPERGHVHWLDALGATLFELADGRQSSAILSELESLGVPRAIGDRALGGLIERALIRIHA